MSSAAFTRRLDAILARKRELEERMSRASGAEVARLAREHAELAELALVIERWRAALEERDGLRELLQSAGDDAELRALAEEELRAVEARLPELERQLKLALLPRDAVEEKNVILELRAGTGGEEAALFAADLLRMYQRYAERRGFQVELLSLSESDLGGVKEAIARIQGRGAYGRLRFEGGVHRVQRVPVTEAGGRIHTSTATVAVLPEAEEVDVRIDEKDLRVDVFRASGAGGQHVNRTESAVRITHLPTGITVSIQDEKSQHRNRARAMQILRARLFELERRRRQAERAGERREQIGSGERSERIRTYNFPQGRVTDHRIGLTLYRLSEVLAGEALDEIIDALIAEDQTRRLAQLEL